jgi:hypothetical protein
MSYDITLTDPVTKDTISFDAPHQMRGGTYVRVGTDQAWLNITYNHAQHFRKVLGEHGIRTIYGLSGAESTPLLASAIAALGDDAHVDYWTATEGNAKRALRQLLAMAQLRPDGIWDGD